MGSFSNFYINNHLCFSWGGDIKSDVLALFRDGDIELIDRKDEKYAGFKSSLNIVFDRIKIIDDGFEHMEFMFEENINNEIRSSIELFPHIDEKAKSTVENENSILKNNSLYNFLEILKSEIEDTPPDEEEVKKLKEFILTKETNVFDYKSYNIGTYSLLYLLGKKYPSYNWEVRYDVSEKCAYNDFKGDFYGQLEMLDFMKDHEFKLGEKIIILTEGNTDRLSIENALKILKPHLVEYYQFMDFDLVDGSVSSLIKIIKSFISAKIKNKVIAILDNDTAAYEAVHNIANIDIPDNFKIIHLPNLDIAFDYPTFGPNGIVNMDINGLAVGIEFFYGEEVISDNRKYYPVQWTGFSKKMNRYQGSILNKTQINSKFKEKVKICLKNKERTEDYDWNAMELLLENIFDAFKS